MRTRRSFLQSGAGAFAVVALGDRPTHAADAPGITETEIRIGQTMPYSGPSSAYGAIGRTEVGYFKMVNDLGGINRRKVNLISLDDGYSPPKTVEQTRRLVEQQQGAFIFGSVGTAQNAAIRPISMTTRFRRCSSPAASAGSLIRGTIPGRSPSIPATGPKDTSSRNTSSAPDPMRRSRCCIRMTIWARII